MKKFVSALFDSKLAAMALKVSDTVGSVLVTIERDAALAKREMTNRKERAVFS